jgi:hypothetical protein
MKPEVKLKEIAELERRVSRLEGDVRTLAKLVADLASVRVQSPPFVLESPFAPKTEVEKILGPRIT